MNETWVIDSSIGVAWVHANQATPATQQLLQSVKNGPKMVIPTLWYPEVANTLLQLERRKKMATENKNAALLFLDAIEFIIDEQSIRETLRTTFGLAAKYTLTIYDATYLEVALRRGLALASRDAELNHAARQCGVKTL